MTKPYLLSGSFAYDTVLNHPQTFSQRIKPDAIDKLNTSFHIDSVSESFGGCAGNISYNAAHLNDKPMLVGNLGMDCDRYLACIEGWGLDTSTLGVVFGEPTAHAWMLTDSSGNQISSFHAGAMKSSVQFNPFSTPLLWHLAPEDPVNMVRLALLAREVGAEYFFDPGQALPALLEGVADHIAPLKDVIGGAKGIFVNEYEADQLFARLSLRDYLTNRYHFVVRTRGSAGVDLFHSGTATSLGPAPADSVVDPTGCGDAFRAGFLHAYVREHSLESCVALGAVMGALAVGSEGGQSHAVTCDDVYARSERYRDIGHIV